MTENEIKQIELDITQERNYFRINNKERDPLLMKKCFGLLAAICVLNYPMLVEAFEVVCPHCETSLEINPTATVKEKKWPMPDTWICSGCGYENYDGITYCGKCGTRR